MHAGQFCHVPEAAFDAELSTLYNINKRLDLLREDKSLARLAEEAVSIALVKATESRLIPRGRGFYDARTISYFAVRLGVTCALCLKIDNGGEYDLGLAMAFSRFVCPTMIRVDDPKFRQPEPLCRNCKYAVKKVMAEFPGKQGDMHFIDTLSRLPRYARFKDRVRENAANLALLRFDPRYVVYTQKRQRFVEL